MASYRKNRLSEEIKRCVADILREDISDPRIAFVSVVDVEAKPDLDVAKIYVSVLGNEQAQTEAAKALEKARSFIRRQLGFRMKLRQVPEIVIICDHSIAHGVHMAQLIDQTRKEDEDGKAEAGRTDEE